MDYKKKSLSNLIRKKNIEQKKFLSKFQKKYKQIYNFIYSNFFHKFSFKIFYGVLDV